ncbi:MAG: homoserine dehydrogenase, partial [Clostridia bacterium]|nr:homoserine dehydrogenase [Clostridia bacterium]
YPTLVPYGNMLAGVDDVFNAIMVHGDSVDDVMFYGRGAGKLPTASAVVADVIDCVKHIKARKYVFWDKEIDNYVTDVNNEKTKLFVLLDGFDRQRFEAQFKPLELKETAYGTAAIIEGVYGDLIDELKNADFVNVKSELRVLK